MGVTLLLGLLLTQAPANQRVTSVELRLPPDTDPQVVADAPGLVAVRKGQELTQHAVRKTIERLIETGRLADVVVRAVDVADGVEVIIEAVPVRQLGDVYVDGNHAVSTTELLTAAKMEPGGEVSAERLAEAEEVMRALFARRGYRHVEVISQRTLVESRIDVVFTVLEGEPTRLKSVVFAGESGVAIEKLLGTLQLVPGSVVEQREIDAGLDRLRERLRKDHFYRARVDGPSYDADGNLQVPLFTGPQFQIRIDGNQTFSNTVVASVNNYDGQEALEESVIARIAQRMTSFYQHQGFHDVKVLPRVVVSPDGAKALLTFHIEEGRRVLVRSLRFVGNTAVTTRELTKVLAEVMRNGAPLGGSLPRTSDGLQSQGRVAEPASLNPFEPDPETVLVDDEWRDAASAMQSLYRDRGYLQATVILTDVEIGESGAQATFEIREGPRTDYKSVTVLGAPEGSIPADKSWVALGSPFSRRSLENVRQQIQTALNSKGWLFARVEATFKVENEIAAHATIRTVSGPQVQLGKVIVRGLKRTKESVVRRSLVLKEGKPLKPDDLLDTQRNLIGLGIFSSVDVRVLSPENVEAAKDVVIEVAEQKTFTGEFGFGYSYAEGLRGMVDGQFPNVGGQAISIAAHAQVNLFFASGLAISRVVDVSDLPVWQQIGGQANISAFNRGLMPFDIGSHLDLLFERLFRPSFFFTRVAAAPGFDWPTQVRLPFIDFAPLRNTLALTYEFDVSRVQQASSASSSTFPLLSSDQERLRFSFGTFVLQTVRLSETIDLRDNPAVPHRGIVLQANIERTGQVYAADEAGNPVVVQFIKAWGGITGYVPVTGTATLALSARAGKIFPVAPGSVTPPVKRFFLGGSSTIRGFQEQNLLPEDARATLRNEVANCRALSQSYGCTSGATSIAAGQAVASQGGELSYVGRAELRFPVIAHIDLGLFFEAGDLWLGAPTAFTLRPVAGTGVRYETPIGPLALDIGFNLQPDQVVNEPTFQVHFNVGVF